jgi:hypothetical protein
MLIGLPPRVVKLLLAGVAVSVPCLRLNGEGFATAAQGQTSSSMQDEIAEIRRQILELQKDIAAKQAKWDKLHAEYLRIMNLTGGRLSSAAQSKITKLDADARKIKADIDAQTTVLVATQEHLERLEEERTRRDVRDAMERDRQSRPVIPPSLNSSSDSQEAQADDARVLETSDVPSVLMVDLSDPIGAGGQCAAQYLVERIGVNGTQVEEGESFRVEFDDLGFPIRVPGYREYRKSERGGTEVLDAESEPMARFVVVRRWGDSRLRILNIDRVIGHGQRESGSKWVFGEGPRGHRLEMIEFESKRLMFEFDMVGSSLPPVWQRIGSADGTERISFSYYPSGRVSSVNWDSKSIEYSYGPDGALEEAALEEGGRVVARVDFDGWDEAGRWISSRLITVNSLGKERTAFQLRRVFDGGPSTASFPRREFNLLGGPTELAELPPAESPQILAAQAEAARQAVAERDTSVREAEVLPTRTDSAESGGEPGVTAVPTPSEPSPPAPSASDPTALNLFVCLACVLLPVSVVVGWRVTPVWTYGWIASSMMSARGVVQRTGIGTAQNSRPGLTDEQAELRAKVMEFGVRLIIALLFGYCLVLWWFAKFAWRKMNEVRH